ncbi:MAG: lipopolysaccharide heptosyltransferase I [Pyrinomonadaceae bacterium]
MKILIVKVSSIGDVVHALPTLAAIRRALPAAEISWAVEKGAAEILRDNPHLSNLIEVDTRAVRREKSWAGKWRLMRGQFDELRSQKFDVALDFQGLLKSSLLARLSGASRRVGFAKESLREPASRFLLTETVEIGTRISVIEKNLRLAEKALQIEIPVRGDDYEFPITTNESHKSEAENAMRETGGKFVILNPGGGWTTKLWDAEKFGTLADRIFRELNLKSIITFGPGEESLAERVLAASKSNQTMTASLSLKGFYELSKRAELYFGGDTGPTHLAVAAGTPVVGIFGPTEWWRNGSPRMSDVCVERFDIGCRENCHRRSCNNWICMDISVERVLQAVKKRLESAKMIVKSESCSIV